MAVAKAENGKEWAVQVSQSFLDYRKTPLSDRHKIMLLTLESFARLKSVCWVGNDVLEERTGKSSTTVQEILGELEKLSLIRRVVEQGKGKRTKRTGFLLLSRVHPGYPAADDGLTTSEAAGMIESERGSTIPKPVSIAPGNPVVQHPEKPEISTRKSGSRIRSTEYNSVDGLRPSMNHDKSPRSAGADRKTDGRLKTPPDVEEVVKLTQYLFPDKPAWPKLVRANCQAYGTDVVQDSLIAAASTEEKIGTFKYILVTINDRVTRRNQPKR